MSITHPEWLTLSADLQKIWIIRQAIADYLDGGKIKYSSSHRPASHIYDDIPSIIINGFLKSFIISFSDRIYINEKKNFLCANLFGLDGINRYRYSISYPDISNPSFPDSWIMEVLPPKKSCLIGFPYQYPASSWT